MTGRGQRPRLQQHALLLFVAYVQAVRQFRGEIGFSGFIIRNWDLTPEKKDGAGFETFAHNTRRPA